MGTSLLANCHRNLNTMKVVQALSLPCSGLNYFEVARTSSGQFQLYRLDRDAEWDKCFKAENKKGKLVLYTYTRFCLLSDIFYISHE